MSRTIGWLVFVAIANINARAQFSAFASTSYGYHTNPLYNYQTLSDQVKQSYLQMMYGVEIGSSYLSASYVNGIALFNRFDDRNYFEHSFNGAYTLRFGGENADDPQYAESGESISAEDTSSSASDDAVEDNPASNGFADELTTNKSREESNTTVQTEEQTGDSTGLFLDLGVKITNRVDKGAHKEFDNIGGEQIISFRMMMGEGALLRINNILGYRSYTNLSEISNTHDLLNVQVRNNANASIGFGLNAGGGVKHYVNAVTDTTKFESVRSYIIKPAGHGKPGGKIQSTRLLLANASTNTSYQFVTGFFVEKKWSETSVAYDLLLRINSKNAPRYLAQSTTASGLNEDIYNDQFSYAGWEMKLSAEQQLIAGIKANVVLELQRKRFGAASYDLVGNQTSVNRLDHRTSAELTLTRNINLFDGVDLELLLLGGLLRNESNDEYSDFSARSVAFGLGIGF